MVLSNKDTDVVTQALEVMMHYFDIIIWYEILKKHNKSKTILYPVYTV